MGLLVWLHSISCHVFVSARSRTVCLAWEDIQDCCTHRAVRRDRNHQAVKLAQLSTLQPRVRSRLASALQIMLVRLPP